MKRTKETKQVGEERLNWRKTRGVMYLGKRKIDASHGPVKFKARRSEIPDAFLDTIECMDVLPEDRPLVSATKFEIQHAGGGWYNVVETTSGKAMNETKLRQKEANELMESLQ